MSTKNNYIGLSKGAYKKAAEIIAKLEETPFIGEEKSGQSSRFETMSDEEIETSLSSIQTEDLTFQRVVRGNANRVESNPNMDFETACSMQEMLLTKLNGNDTSERIKVAKSTIFGFHFSNNS